MTRIGMIRLDWDYLRLRIYFRFNISIRIITWINIKFGMQIRLKVRTWFRTRY